MKIALLGYGKMGKTIERIALERGHEIVLRVDAPGEYDLSVAQVAIEFSTMPPAAPTTRWTRFDDNSKFG